jgi:MoaA/NifB/PqqE/SkfB family radical SAM enzyme
MIKYESNFFKINDLRLKYPDIADYIEGKTEKFNSLPTLIVAGFDNVCNLRCKSCTITDFNKQSKEISQIYINEIEKMGTNLERLLISGYGDPFASPAYRNWLTNFPNEKFPKLKTIEILTNGLLWTEENWIKISRKIKNYKIYSKFSIDGATKETYEYNRGNAKFETLKMNLEYISKLRLNNELKSLDLQFVVQQNNYKEIPLIIEFAKNYHFDSIFFLEIRNWGTYTSEEFKKIDIIDKKHPEYKYIKKIYREVKKTEDKSIKIDFGFVM